MDDDHFYALLRKALGKSLVYSYPSKITGVKHRNADGRSRSKLVDECRQFEVLLLERQPDNPVDPQAVMVLRSATGEQLGYLPERTAHDLLKDRPDPGCAWIAVFRQAYTERGGSRTVGALIEIVMCKVA